MATWKKIIVSGSDPHLNNITGSGTLKLDNLSTTESLLLKPLVIDSNGDVIHIHYMDRLAKWDKDDLIDFEAKVLKLEEAKVKLDEKDKKEKPIKLRKQEYHRIDELLFEALVEKHEEGRPEKMVEYLKLRKEIKDKHPLED